MQRSFNNVSGSRIAVFQQPPLPGPAGAGRAVRRRDHGALRATERRQHGGDGRGAEIRSFRLSRLRPEIRQAADPRRHRSRQGGELRSDDARCRRCADFAAGWRFRQLFQPVGPRLSGRAAGGTGGAPQRRPVAELLHPHGGRHGDPAGHLLATLQTSVVPEALNHFQQLNAATITAIPRAGPHQRRRNHAACNR